MRSERWIDKRIVISFDDQHGNDLSAGLDWFEFLDNAEVSRGEECFGQAVKGTLVHVCFEQFRSPRSGKETIARAPADGGSKEAMRDCAQEYPSPTRFSGDAVIRGESIAKNSATESIRILSDKILGKVTPKRCSHNIELFDFLFGEDFQDPLAKTRQCVY